MGNHQRAKIPQSRIAAMFKRFSAPCYDNFFFVSLLIHLTQHILKHHYGPPLNDPPAASQQVNFFSSPPVLSPLPASRLLFYRTAKEAERSESLAVSFPTHGSAYSSVPSLANGMDAIPSFPSTSRDLARKSGTAHGHRRHELPFLFRVVTGFSESVPDFNPLPPLDSVLVYPQACGFDTGSPANIFQLGFILLPQKFSEIFF